MSEYLRTPPSQRARGDPSPITPARRRPQQGTEGDLTLAEREEKFLTMKTPAAWHKYQQQYSGHNNHDVGNKRTPPQIPPRERGLEAVIKFFSPSPSPPSPHR